DRRLAAKRPRTILGLIPIGSVRQNFPVDNIAGVSSATRFDVLGVLVGAIGFLFGVAALTIPATAVLGALLIVIGVACIVGAPKQAIEVMNSGGGTISFPVSALERSRTVEFTNHMAEALARAGGRTRVPSEPSQFASPTPSSDDPAAALQQLLGLRDRGLITDDEYAAKRAEILARL